MTLTPHLRMVVWPRKFRTHLLEKYDGTVSPTEFLQIYSTSILAAGGNEAIMANYFPRGSDWYNTVMAREPIRGNAHLLARDVPPVHGQLRECLLSAGQ
jgi:hypothetical protein